MPLLVTDRTSRRKISRNIDDLDNTKSQLDLAGIYKTLYPTTAEYRFFPSSNRTFPKQTILNPKTNLNKYKIEIIQR